jgi:hypothetical protein
MKKVTFEFGLKVIKISKSETGVLIEVNDDDSHYPTDLSFNISRIEAEDIANEIIKLIKDEK